MPDRPAPWTPPRPPPMRFAAGDLLIRAHEHSDAEALFAAVESSRATLTPWIPWALTDNRTLSEVTYTIERFRRSALSLFDPATNTTFGYVYGIFDASTGELLGGTGFNRLSPENHNAETGYWVRQDRRRRGICSRTLAAMLSWGFTPQSTGGFGFRRIHLFAAAKNTASCAVPKKLGLNQSSCARAERWVEGLGWSDFIGWDVLADEWDTTSHTRRNAARSASPA